MIDFLAVSLFGWPAILVTIILAMVGLFKKDYRILVAAAMLAFPFSWFLSGFPLIRSLVFLMPLLLFGSGYFMYRAKVMLAWLVAVPYFLMICLLFIVVASQ